MSAATRRTALLVVAALAVLAGCVTDRPAPVVDRSIGAARREPQSPPDHYVVERGDTLYSVAFRYGLDFKRVARWNEIAPPYTIYPGQRLRLQPRSGSDPGRTEPARTADAEVKTEPLPEGRSGSRESEPAPAAQQPGTNREDAARSGRDEEPAGRQPAPTQSAGPAPAWQWPAAGEILSTFASGDASRNGIDIGADSATPVRAAAGGQVVYSGSGLIGYGELIIVKHDNALLSAYGHNRKRLVQEGDQVQAGQKIAEMGQTGAPRPMLHFEIREDGTPVDPMKYLPER